MLHQIKFLQKIQPPDPLPPVPQRFDGNNNRWNGKMRTEKRNRSLDGRDIIEKKRRRFTNATDLRERLDWKVSESDQIVSRVESENQELKDTLERKEAHIAEMARKLCQKEAANLELSKKNHDNLKKIEELRREIYEAKQKTEIVELEKSKTLESERLGWKEKIRIEFETKQKKMDEKTQKKLEEVAKQKDLTDKINSLTSQNFDLEEQARKNKIKIAKLEEEAKKSVAEFQVKHEAVMNKNVQLEFENFELKQKLTEAEKTAANSTAALKSEKELNELRQALEREKKQLDHSKGTISNCAMILRTLGPGIESLGNKLIENL